MSTRRLKICRAASTVALGLGLVCAMASLSDTAVSWASPWRASRNSRSIAMRAAKKAAAQGLPNGPSDVFNTVVEGYDPDGPHEFVEGPPPTGYRHITEAIRPYHPNPEWMIFPESGFALDQKMCSLYTLATGLFKNINEGLREDNEDSIRRHMTVIHKLREVLRFKVKTICTPEGRKCKPFIGKVQRGMSLPADQVEAIANQYKVGTEFTWPGFTSTQLDDAGLWPFDGNLNFEIECNIDPQKLKVDEVYAPVRISRFMQGSNEVLFPPQTKFKVVGEREVERVKENEETKDVYTRILEVVELPTPKA